jgi:hypothetical protein
MLVKNIYFLKINVSFLFKISLNHEKNAKINNNLKREFPEINYLFRIGTNTQVSNRMFV